MLNPNEKQHLYLEVKSRIDALIQGESDWISLLSTVTCELHHHFNYFDWTGFYRVTQPQILKVGPYQGGHGCLTIDFNRGVCGAVAREKKLIRLDDVHTFENHIFCSSSTMSEIVIPVLDKHQQLVAVLDVDSDSPAAFCQVDETHLSEICDRLTPFAPIIG